MRGVGTFLWPRRAPALPSGAPLQESSRVPPPLRPLESFCSCPALAARRPASLKRTLDARGAGRAGRSGRARGRAQRDPPRQTRVSRTAAPATYGWGGAGLGSPTPTPAWIIDSRPKTPPRRGSSPPRSRDARSHLALQPPSPCGPRSCHPSIPGARRGRLRSSAPTPRRASRVPEHAGRGVRRARCVWPSAGPQLGPVQRLTIPGPARIPRVSPPALRAVRAQSGPGQRRGSPPRPIRPRIFPLVGRPGAARQPAPIGWAQGDAGLPLGHRDVRPGRRPTPPL